jgi:hypothetical protein
LTTIGTLFEAMRERTREARITIHQLIKNIQRNIGFRSHRRSLEQHHHRRMRDGIVDQLDTHAVASGAHIKDLF